MTKLLTRKEIIETKKIISSELAKMQRLIYDEETLQYYKEENEEQEYWDQFDCFEKEAFEYPSQHKIIGLSHSNIDTFTDQLSGKLKELFQLLNIKDFIILAHLKLDFFGNRKNKYKPLVKAYEKLEKIVGQKTYKEGFMIEVEDLPAFVEILFWITRCDPSVPEYIFLFDKNEKIQMNLCRYGNIHLSQFDKEWLSNDKLTSLGWSIIDEQECDNFSSEGKIEGREIKL
jgi:hypothetical protein